MNTGWNAALISVYIPVYNAERYIARALLSALNQTYENIEYILVNDCCTDHTMAVVNTVLATHPRGGKVRIIHHGVNKGTAITRNAALDAARGDYLFTLDNDDEITPDCLQKLYNTITRTGVDIVSASHCNIKDGKITSSVLLPEHTFRDAGVLLRGEIFQYFPIMIWNKLYRMSFIRRYGIRCMDAHTLYEDYYFSLKALIHLRLYATLPDVTCYCHYRPDSITAIGAGDRRFFSDTPVMFADERNLIHGADIDTRTKIHLKWKHFWRRVYIAEQALKSSRENHPYIARSLSPAFLWDGDTLRSVRLMTLFIISCMPLCLKKQFLKIHIKSPAFGLGGVSKVSLS
jgi:glycosyltransferase involved in cell wall biosynthesis